MCGLNSKCRRGLFPRHRSGGHCGDRITSGPHQESHRRGGDPAGRRVLGFGLSPTALARPSVCRPALSGPALAGPGPALDGHGPALLRFLDQWKQRNLRKGHSFSMIIKCDRDCWGKKRVCETPCGGSQVARGGPRKVRFQLSVCFRPLPCTVPTHVHTPTHPQTHRDTNIHVHTHVQ